MGVRRAQGISYSKPQSQSQWYGPHLKTSALSQLLEQCRAQRAPCLHLLPLLLVQRSSGRPPEWPEGEESPVCLLGGKKEECLIRSADLFSMYQHPKTCLFKKINVQREFWAGGVATVGTVRTDRAHSLSTLSASQKHVFLMPIMIRSYEEDRKEYQHGNSSLWEVPIEGHAELLGDSVITFTLMLWSCMLFYLLRETSFGDFLYLVMEQQVFPGPS